MFKGPVWTQAEPTLGNSWAQGSAGDLTQL